MNPLLFATLRKNWRIVGALAALVIFTFIHLVLYRPAAARYRAVLASAGGIETVFNPSRGFWMIPPRSYALITENMLPEREVVERSTSGAMGVELLEEIGRAAEQTGLRVIMSEPGLVTQEPLSAQVRAHLKLTGSYERILAFLAALSENRSLLLIERFAIRIGEGTSDEFEIWISRVYLKQQGPKP